MTHDQFRIGDTFWCGSNEWRCIGIGRRPIKAILGTRIIDGTERTETFDTFDMQGCSVSKFHCPECLVPISCQTSGACMQAANEPDI